MNDKLQDLLKNNNLSEKQLEYLNEIVKRNLIINNEYCNDIFINLMSNMPVNNMDEIFHLIFSFCREVNMKFEERTIKLILRMMYNSYDLVKEIHKNISLVNNSELTEEQAFKILELEISIVTYDTSFNGLINKISNISNGFIKHIIDKETEMYKYLVESGKIIPCFEHLKLSVLYKNKDLVKYIILHKVIPTNEVLQYLFIRNVHHIENVYYIENSQDILNVLLELGIRLTKFDVINIFMHRLDINKNYVELIDDEVFQLCLDNYLYPKSLSKFKPSLLSVQYLMTYAYSLNIWKIPEYILNTISLCDFECLKASLEQKGNIALKFVLSRKIIDVDYETIKNLVNEYYPNDEEIQDMLLELKN